MARAEIIDGEPHAQPVKFLHYLPGAREVLHDHILGNLEYEQLGREADGVEGGRRLGRQPALLELAR